MNSEEFVEFGKAALDLIVDYHTNIRNRKVLPSVSPGYLLDLIPEKIPDKSESWKEVLEDIERVIMPGMTHWQSPNFHAFFSSGCSYPSIIGEMLMSAITFQNSDMDTGLVATELEMIVMDWLAKLLDLPKEFLNSSGGPGGGSIQASVSETTFVLLIAAKEKAVKHYKALHPEMDEAMIRAKLVAYSSDQSNSSVEKAGFHASVPMRLLPTDKSCSLTIKVLEDAIEKDKRAGLIPCYVLANLGTTGTCAFDNLEEIGPYCNEQNVWLHADAAYAGSALCCEELRPLMKGLGYLDSFSFNPHKGMLVNFDLSACFVKDSTYLKDAIGLNKTDENTFNTLKDYSYWQISLERKFKALKLWFMLRSYGAKGIRSYIRRNVKLAKYFEDIVTSDERFEVTNPASLGVVCFRVKGDDFLTENLLCKLNERKIIYVIPATWDGKLIIRFVICSEMCKVSDVDFSWNEITSQLDVVLFEYNNHC